MSQLLLRRLCFSKPASVRSSSLLLSKGFSSPSLQNPPCVVIGARRRRAYDDFGSLIIFYANDDDEIYLDKKVPMELIYNYATVTIGASHGWVATYNKDERFLRLRDDLNPNASYANPKSIPLPPLVTLPHCQTRIVTNVSMSSSSPDDDEDCVVAVKFLGPQLSFCRPARSHPEWTNIRIRNPCFFSSRVMFSKKDNMFRIPGSGGHLMGSWTHKHDNPKFQSLRFRNLPKLTKTKRELLDSCSTSEHLVESPDGETFLVKWYRKTAPEKKDGKVRLKTTAVMVFKVDEEGGNAVYTRDIGDLYIFLSKSEPFCVHASSFPDLCSNRIELMDFDESVVVDLADDSSMIAGNAHFWTPYHIPPGFEALD
ncbi:PREDICTED: uncharacterized protein LOC104725963 [Camelina sativa]|uniref:Uncharacterized protein LOC104725963 n=1 Tax=Camelina sativa TaxID=90675 RepID=A0ABM0ULS3_CAMSA|nr:PREDICTED: uncharacterized protein LOC104725963 [Camelina sativa]